LETKFLIPASYSSNFDLTYFKSKTGGVPFFCKIINLKKFLCRKILYRRSILPIAHKNLILNLQQIRDTATRYPKRQKLIFESALYMIYF